MVKEVKRTERGWGGHFCGFENCRFRRNTLLEYKDMKIVVSTVGQMYNARVSKKITEIGWERYYETRAFHADTADLIYHDADVSRQVNFESKWSLSKPSQDNEANDMHEAVVKEITSMLLHDKIKE